MVYWVILAVAAVLVLLVVAGYNRLVKTRNKVRESWADIDVQLKRRFDLVANLVKAVQGYAAHEASLQPALAAARAVAESGRDATAQLMLTDVQSHAVAVAEAYPDLKASSNFLTLQQALAQLEDEIAAAREIYNSNVRIYNTRLQSFPGNVYAALFSFTVASLYQADAAARATPTVAV
jgi:LemA protein